MPVRIIDPFNDVFETKWDPKKTVLSSLKKIIDESSTIDETFSSGIICTKNCLLELLGSCFEVAVSQR